MKSVVSVMAFASAQALRLHNKDAPLTTDSTNNPPVNSAGGNNPLPVTGTYVDQSGQPHTTNRPDGTYINPDTGLPYDGIDDNTTPNNQTPADLCAADATMCDPCVLDPASCAIPDDPCVTDPASCAMPDDPCAADPSQCDPCVIDPASCASNPTDGGPGIPDTGPGIPDIGPGIPDDVMKHNIFDFFDKNNNGGIEIDELLGNFQTTTGEYKQWGQRLFSLADKNGDGKVQFDEFDAPDIGQWFDEHQDQYGELKKEFCNGTTLCGNDQGSGASDDSENENSGNENSGNDNSGNENENSGNENSGNDNSGNENSGNEQNGISQDHITAAVWGTMDTNDDDTVSRKEFYDAAASNWVKKLFDAVDKNGDGKIQMAEAKDGSIEQWINEHPGQADKLKNRFCETFPHACAAFHN